MKTTYQTSKINMLDHGLMVSESYNRIFKKDIKYIQHFGFSPEDLDILLSFQHDHILMRNYHIYHDCGKPFCQTTDENGKNHYPDHAVKSAQIYQKYFDCEIANILIQNDMAFHALKSEELLAWLLIQDKNIIASLYLTAWSEIFANSAMFGGFESDSFKIKIKEKKLNSSFKKLKPLF